MFLQKLNLFREYVANQWPIHFGQSTVECQNDLLPFVDSMCDGSTNKLGNWVKAYNNPNVRAWGLFTCPPLSLASYFGIDPFVKWLLDRGADINGASEDLYEGIGTALVCAVEEGHVSTVDLLIKNGADLNVVYGDITALWIAVSYDRQEVVRKLLANGADPDIQVGFGETALHLAAREDRQ